MEILDKNQIENKLGKFGLFSGKAGQGLIDKIEYICGIESIDNILSKEKGPMAVYLDIKPLGLQITFMIALHKYRVGILDSDIISWNIEHQEEIVLKKEKSVVGRALLGGLLLGPLGAVVGGISGIGDKKTKLNEYDNIITLSVTNKGSELNILFSCKNKNLVEVRNYLKEKYPTKIDTLKNLK